MFITIAARHQLLSVRPHKSRPDCLSQNLLISPVHLSRSLVRLAAADRRDCIFSSRPSDNQVGRRRETDGVFVILWTCGRRPQAALLKSVRFHSKGQRLIVCKCAAEANECGSKAAVDPERKVKTLFGSSDENKKM